MNLDKLESAKAHAARAIEFIESMKNGNKAAKEWALYHIEKAREFWNEAFADEKGNESKQ
jgi:hypothetical protein